MRFVTEFFRDLRTLLYRNAIFLMANTVVASGIGFFFWMVVARYLRLLLGTWRRLLTCPQSIWYVLIRENAYRGMVVT